MICEIVFIAHLKSSMDRFIDKVDVVPCPYQQYLKSSMDRFIE